MSDEVRPVGGPGPVDPRLERRERERREHQRRSAGQPVPTEPDAAFKPEDGPARAAVPPAPEAGAAAFFAQQMGQSGQKRGLKGGPVVRDAARAAYLGTEYSGVADRRPTTGKAADTDT